MTAAAEGQRAAIVSQELGCLKVLVAKIRTRYLRLGLPS
jgi:hypothetical protein